jgi:hypothetical protein
MQRSTRYVKFATIAGVVPAAGTTTWPMSRVEVPGCRLSVRYCPVVSVVAIRVFSMTIVSLSLDLWQVPEGWR